MFVCVCVCVEESKEDIEESFRNREIGVHVKRSHRSKHSKNNNNTNNDDDDDDGNDNDNNNNATDDKASGSSRKMAHKHSSIRICHPA